MNPSVYGAQIVLFEVDASNYGVDLLRLHDGTNEGGGPIVWQGNQFIPFPIQADGFEHSGGQLPRPKVRIANVRDVSAVAGERSIGELCRKHNDLLGAKVTRIRTYGKFLDAANFEDGNTYADPTAEEPRDVYFIDRKSAETRDVIEFELAAASDCHGVTLPLRPVIASPCLAGPAECQYAATCAHTLDACGVKWGNADLPYTSFPGAGALR